MGAPETAANTGSNAHTYDRGFFEYINSGSLRSAQAIVPLIGDWIRPQSVLDAGCGQGAWLAAWKEAGVADVTGLDGDYVNPDDLLIGRDEFTAKDLSQPFDLGRFFDLAQSLEVAEHLPEAAAAGFIESLTRHAPVVLFSAASPGQGGEFHVNEQPPSYWREKFASHGYVLSDCVRPLIAGRRDIEFWYRYNSFLFIARDRLAEMPAPVRDAVNETGPIPSMASISFRLRASILRLLPVPAVTRLAKIKHAAMRAGR